MRKTKILKKAGVIFLTMGLILGLGGCKSSEEPLKEPSDTVQVSPGTAKPKEKSNMTIAIEATGDIPEEFQKQIDRFNAISENAQFKILTYAGPEAYETAIMGQIAGQSAPDVILLDGGKKIQEYAVNDVIVPLDDYLGDLKGNFEESLIESLTYNGKLYGLTKDYNTSVLFYQLDMLQEKKVEIPKTISEFTEAVAKLTTDSVKGFGCDPKLNYLYPFAATMGADFVNTDGSINMEKLTSQEHKNMLQMFKDMYDNKQADSPYLANAGWDGEMFGNKKIALMYAGSWVTGVIEDTSKAGVAKLPTEKDAVSMLYTTGWCITDQSKDKQSAADLIRFLSSDEELVAGNENGLIGLPPTKTAMDKLIEKKKDDPFLPVYREVVKEGIAFSFIDSKFVDAYNKAFENMIYNNISVEETINKIAKNAEQE